MKTGQALLNQADTLEAAKQATLCLHNRLARELAERYGESLRVDEADFIIEDNVRYAFDELGFRCLAYAAPLNDRAGSIVISARLGRLYKGYPRALRWLACNRAGNSVSLHFDEETNGGRELWVTSHRVTFPDDENGIREMLLDVRSELFRLRTALPCYFPQLVPGARLAWLEEYIQNEKSEGLAAILACPRGYVDAVAQDHSIIERTGIALPIEAASWVCDREKQLKWIDLALNADGDDKPTPAGRLALLAEKLNALAWLRRYEECLCLADQLEKGADESQHSSLATARCYSLYGLGRYNDLLETVRSAMLDDNPRVWYWRSLAHARLGQTEEATKAFLVYESKIGPDIIGRKELEKVLPAEEAAKKGDDVTPNLEIKL